MNNPTLEACPLGSWDWDGSWYPNAMLKMSAEDQRQHNIKHGFIKKPSQSIPKERLLEWIENSSFSEVTGLQDYVLVCELKEAIGSMEGKG